MFGVTHSLLIDLESTGQVDSVKFLRNLGFSGWEMMISSKIPSKLPSEKESVYLSLKFEIRQIRLFLSNYEILRQHLPKEGCYTLKACCLG